MYVMFVHISTTFLFPVVKSPIVNCALTLIALCVSGGKAAEGAADGNEGTQRDLYGA